MATTFITGNQDKANYLAKYLGMPIAHHKLDLDEIQSLDLEAVVRHKVKQAYDILKTPVLVEDVSLEFTAFGRLPGTFIKFFLQEMSLQAICDLLNDTSREAIGRCMFGYYDGTELKVLQGETKGTIARQPAGTNGFGWDAIFIPEGHSVTRAELHGEDYKTVYTKIRPLHALKAFLESRGT